MKSNQVRDRISKSFLVLPLLIGMGSVSTSAQMQSTNNEQGRDRNNGEWNQRGRNWDRYGNYGGSAELRQTALKAGYEDGVAEGRRDRSTGRYADLRSSGNYQRATKDYNSRLGDRDLYRRYFREAFEDGYNTERTSQNADNSSWDRDRDGKSGPDRRNRNRDGYGNFGGSFQLRQTALNAGFNEGIRQGRADRSKRNDNGFREHNAYKKATKDYSSKLGNRDIYERYFREAYENGYADGYGGY